MKKRILLSFILTALFSFLYLGYSSAQITGFSNLTISGGTTTGVTISGTSPNRIVAVTADNAVLNVTTLQTELVSNNVTITTNNATGTQAGNITTIAITSAPTVAGPNTFSITAHGSFIASGSITLTPATPGNNTNGRHTPNIILNAGTSVSVQNIIVKGGQAGPAPLFGSGADGGDGGDITIVAGTSFSCSQLDASGGTATGGSFTSQPGGKGGNISVTTGSTLTINGAVNSSGGAAFLVGSGGNAGTIGLVATGSLTIAGTLTSNGGGGTNDTGGNISLTGTGGVSISASITSTVTLAATRGNLTVNDGSSTVGAGNLGQTAGVINVQNFVKNGAGIFNMAGVNSYAGNTTINNGKVRVSQQVAGNGTDGAFGNNPLGLTTITLSGGGLQFNDNTFTRAIAVSGNTTMDAYGASRNIAAAINGTGTLTIGANTVASAEGQDLTLSAVIGNGAMNLTKSFSSTLTLTATNTFTGTKTLNAGLLNINTAAALGAATGTFVINGGTLGNTSGAGVTMSAYPTTWNGNFAYTGSGFNLNLGTGAVTMNADITITGNANSLIVGGVVNAPTRSFTKDGAGTVTFGATNKTLLNVTASAGTLTQSSAVLSILGNLVNNAAMTAPAAGSTIFNGTTQSISGVAASTPFATLTISNGSTVTGQSVITATTFNINSGGKYIQQAGTSIPGTTKNFVAGSTYELQSTGVTSFGGSTYGFLIINFSGATNSNAGGNLTSILNDLVIQNTGTGSFRLSAGTSPTVTIAGKLIVSGGKFHLVSGAGTPTVTVNGDVELTGGTFQPSLSTGAPLLFVNGNWSNNGGTFTAGISTVNFNSTTAPQNISGSSPNNFYILTNSNTDGSGLSLDASITVSNTLNLSSASNGIFSTGSNTVFVTNGTTGAVTRTGTGYVVGNLKRTIGATGGVYDFPVGSFSGYTPASLNFNNGNTAGDVNVTTTDGASVNYPATLHPTRQLGRTWDITNGGAGAFSADGIFTFLAGDLLDGATDVALKGYKFDAPSTYSYSANTTPGPNTFSFNGITSFSEFGAGECAGTLFVDGTVTNVSCFGGSDGAITSSVSGNTTPFTYSWNTIPIQTTADISGLIAGDYTLTVTEETTCSAAQLFIVTEPPAVTPPTSGGDQTVCQDGNPTQTITATATSDFTITWYTMLTGGMVVPTPEQVGVGSVTYYAEAFDGTCYSVRTPVTLTILAAPAAPTSGGNQSVCEDGNPSQTITATATGGTITWYDAATGGNTVANPDQVGVGTVTYYAESLDGTCNSLTRTAVTLTILAAPVAVGTDQTVCYTGNPTQTITATATGGTITWYDAATGGNVVASPVQVGVGTSTYYAEAFDGTCTSLSRDAVTLSINPAPAVPAAVYGKTNVCPYVGTGEQLIYTIDPVPYASTYRWTMPPTVTLVSATPDSTSITVTINNNFYALVNRVIKVKSISTCGNSADKLFWLLAQTPNTPGQIVPSSTNVCPSLNTNVPITYTIPKTVAATSYGWTNPPGTTLFHINGEGINDTTVQLTFTNAFATSQLSVTAINTCGASGARSLLITRNNPSQPGLISGPTNVCQNIAPSGTPASYTIASVNNAVSYNWTVPVNAIGLTGQGTPSISFTYPAGYTNGNISVTATNNCGTGNPRSLVITSLKPATPSVVDIIQLAACPDRQYSYSLAAMPANAQSIQWTAPPGGTIESGQGTISIVVSYLGTAIDGNLTCVSVNNCGNSVTRTTPIKLPACAPPGPRMSKAPMSTDTRLDADIYPNPSAADFNLRIRKGINEPVQVRITDLQGRTIRKLNTMPFEVTSIGAGLKAGIYLVELRQGKEMKTIKIFKL